MDTPKKNDPKATQTVGDTTTPGPAPPTSGNLVTSGDATSGGSENSDHLEPKEPPTPTVKPALKKDRRKVNPPIKYGSYVLGTKLPQRDLEEKEVDKATKPAVVAKRLFYDRGMKNVGGGGGFVGGSWYVDCYGLGVKC